MSDHKIGDESDDLAELYDEVQTGDIEYMFAQTAGGISTDGTMKLIGVSPTTRFFSYRPYGLTGHIPTGEFIAQWGNGVSNRDLSYAVEVTDGYLAPSTGPLSLFIDAFADGSRRGLLR
jgi:hypothetical protein